jgi:hypothetical protein
MADVTTTETTDDATAASVVADFKSCWDYTAGSYHEVWDSCFKLYNNERVDIAYQGITDSFVPITFTTIEVMVAAIAGGKPKFTFVPQEISQNQDTTGLNGLLDYYWDCDKWGAKVHQWIRSMLMYGTGVMYCYWDIDKPRLLNIPVRDFFFDPTATSPETAAYQGRRYLTTIDELKSFQIVNPETGAMEQKYKNLDQLSQPGDKPSDALDKENKDMFIGSTLGPKAALSQVEVIEWWSKDRVRSVVNRKILIQDDDNPYLVQAKANEDKNPQSLNPFIVQRDYIDESLFLGKGEIEPIMGQQELLNDLTNQNIDSVTYTLNQMYTLDPAYSDWIEKVENLPGAVYPFPAGALNPVVHGQVPPQAFEERGNLKNEIRETTAANEIFGLNLSGGRSTATQLNAIIAQVGQRFDAKTSMLEQDGFHQLGKLVFQMIKLYIKQPKSIRTTGTQGTSWTVYDQEQYPGEYDPMVQLQSTLQKQETADSQKYQVLYTTMLNNPYVNQEEMTKFIMQKEFDLDPDEVDTLMKSQQQMQMEQEQAQEQAMQAQGMPPGAAPGGQPPAQAAPSEVPHMALHG